MLFLFLYIHSGRTKCVESLRQNFGKLSGGICPPTEDAQKRNPAQLEYNFILCTPTTVISDITHSRQGPALHVIGSSLQVLTLREGARVGTPKRGDICIFSRRGPAIFSSGGRIWKFSRREEYVFSNRKQFLLSVEGG